MMFDCEQKGIELGVAIGNSLNDLKFKKPINNYDRIKNMTIGEMAEFLSEIASSWICKNKYLTVCDECVKDVTKCKKDFAICMYEQYLLQEVNENENV